MDGKAVEEPYSPVSAGLMVFNRGLHRLPCDTILNDDDVSLQLAEMTVLLGIHVWMIGKLKR